MTTEELREQKRQILIKVMKKDESIVELREIRELMSILVSKDFKQTPDKELTEAIVKLMESVDKIPEKINVDIPAPEKINFPEKFKIDWENQPKTQEQINIETPKSLDDNIAKLLELTSDKSELKELNETLLKILNREEKEINIEQPAINVDIPESLNENIAKLLEVTSDKSDLKVVNETLLKILNREEKEVNVEVKEQPVINVTIPDKILGEVEVKIPEKVKVEEIIFPDKFGIDWENAPTPEKVHVTQHKVEFPKKYPVDWENMPKQKDTVEVKGLDESLKQLIPKDEIPDNVDMKLNDKDLWDKVSINYPNSTISVKIDRNKNDVINRLIFAKE